LRKTRAQWSKGGILRNWIIIVLAGAAMTGGVSLPAGAQDQQAVVARGAYLINGPAACGNCHTRKNPDLSPRNDMFLAGGERFDTPVFTAYSRNLTPDKDSGIGTWTDEQIIRAMREGVTKEGEILGPPMPVPTYHNMSDDDAKAIVAYLRTINPVHNEVPESKYKIPLQPQVSAKGYPAPAKSDKVAYGGYLVNAIAHCFECHSTPDEHGEPDVAGHMGAGGFPLPIWPEASTKPGSVIFSLNITPDQETGIGTWSDDQIKRAITEGIDKDGKQLFPLMPFGSFKKMTPDDLDAIVAYLHTIKPIRNKIEPNPTLQSLLK
jgi:mono/diheme cytochrome c family protein